MSKKKRSPDTELLGQQAINVIEEILLKMGFLWHVAGPFDHGIDGRIELRDVRAKQPLNRLIGVQSKGWAHFTAETDDSFEFLCDVSDIDYWMRSDIPVLLICSHPDARDAWFVVVSDWFADKQRRAERRVLFDKHKDRFNDSRAAELMRLGERSEPILHRRKPAPPEELLTNMLPVLEHNSRIWSAPCEYYTAAQVGARYDETPGPRPSDYLLRDGRLYSLRDPGDCRLRDVCDANEAENFAAADWSASHNPKLTRYWSELLRRTLLQQVKHQLRWQPHRGVFYFSAPDPLDSLSIQGPSGKRQVVKVERYVDKHGEERIGYVRHHAFHPGFQRVDETWYLEIEPDYVYTSEGKREHGRADTLLAGIKRLDRNLAVLGHLRMWEHLLTRPPSLLDREAALLTFGPLATVDVPFGIDDALWRGKDVDADAIDGQQELAA